MEIPARLPRGGALAAKKEFEKQKRPFVVEGNLEIVSDDGELVGLKISCREPSSLSMRGTQRKARWDELPD
jgi:hypothetical protein